MTTKSANPPIKTIEITNFGGQLTRTLNGDLNSGLAKFATSYGYDFFSKPGNLTWLEQPSDITGNILGLPLAAKTRYISENNPSVYLITSTGKIYHMWVSNINSGGTNPIVNSVVGIGSVLAGSATYTYGASMDFFGVPSTIAVSSVVSQEKIFIGSDNQVNSIQFDSGLTGFNGDAVVGSVNNYTPNKYHPLKKFTGLLLVGDGQAVDSIDNTNTVRSSVFGSLPTESRVRDIDISPDGNYALISSTTNDYEPVSTVQEQITGAITSDGTVFFWNGADLNPTALNTIPGSQVTALQTYLQNSIFFITDSMGSALSDGTNKILSLPNNKAPFPNATGTNGNFLFWSAVELDTSQNKLTSSMYYYGSIDASTPPGLYRLLRQFSTLSNLSGNVLQTPLNLLTSTSYSNLNASLSSVMSVGYGQHYYSTLETNGTQSVLSLKSFCFPPSKLQPPQFGIYETQTQLFSKKIAVKQVRVYTEPTAVNNAFNLYLIGGDGNPLSVQNPGVGFLQYQFAAGTDITKLQGSLERIDFNPSVKDTYALGIQIQQEGSTNMTIKKIEVDYVESGK